jgi:hypothetical protein
MPNIYELQKAFYDAQLNSLNYYRRFERDLAALQAARG